MSSLLDDLASVKTAFHSENARRAEELLQCIQQTQLDSPQDLIRAHELVLFMRAYPHSPEVLRLADEILSRFYDRMRGQYSSNDRSNFDDPEISGMAGAAVSSNYTFEIAHGLVARHPGSVRIDWDNYARPDRLGAALARFFPAAAEMWTVEPQIDWRAWFESAGLTLSWLHQNLDPHTYDLLEIPILWDLGTSSASRTSARLPHGKAFYHTSPLLRRSDVSLDAEFAAAPIRAARLAPPRAQSILNRIADNSAARYRELWGFTHPDPRHIYHARLGRGTDFFFFGVPKQFRLPLRAYHCGVFAKNGVPLGYIETLSLFERAEVGFNLYYTFREGETAWLYASILKVMREHLGVTAFSIDPYQIGHDNEEAIESGAFWFYRKLGFRPTSPEVMNLVQREERHLASNREYRTPASTLRKIARGPLIYGPPEADAWGAFSLERYCQQVGQTGVLTPDLQKAKDAPEELGYLRLLQCDAKLRRRVLRLGAR